MLVHTFPQFLRAVASYMDHPATANMRVGQKAFNLLDRVRPDLAFMLKESLDNPFHNDEALPGFYDFVCRHWGEV